MKLLKQLVWGSIRSGLRDSLSTPYGLIEQWNLSILDADILIKVQQVRWTWWTSPCPSFCCPPEINFRWTSRGDHSKMFTSFMSTNVKLRLRFDVNLRFHWRSPEPHLTIISPSPDPNKTLTLLRLGDFKLHLKFLKLHLTLTWCSPDIYLTSKPSSEFPLTLT